MSCQLAVKGLVPNAVIPSANAPLKDESKLPVVIMIGTASRAMSISIPWKKSVQQTAL